jgi:excisionase family DNA binding protein
MREKEFYSVEEVAQILSLSRDRIYEYLRTGYIAGVRLTKHSAWRIPAAELARLTGYGSTKSKAQLLTKSQAWADMLDLATQFRDALSYIGPKDWAIWGLPDTGQPPLTSQAGLRIWTDRGEPQVELTLEKDHRFPLFISRLKGTFSEFKNYDRWKKSLVEFITMCWTAAHEIWDKAENKTGLNLTPIPVMGRGQLLNVPEFVYEFALDNYASDNRPDLAILEGDANHHKLVPKGYPNYILAVGSRDEITRCEEVTMSLSNEYTKDGRVGEIKARAIELRRQTEPFLIALSTILKEAIGDS